MTELEVNLNNFWIINAQRKEGKEKRKREARRRGKGKMTSSLHPLQTLNLRALCTSIFPTDRTPGVYQVIHNHGYIRNSASIVLREKCVPILAIMHFWLWLHMYLLCAQLRTLENMHHSQQLLSVFIFLSQISAACPCSGKTSPFDGSPVSLYLMPEIHTPFKPNTFHTAEISTSLNSFQVWTLENETIPGIYFSSQTNKAWGILQNPTFMINTSR